MCPLIQLYLLTIIFAVELATELFSETLKSFFIDFTFKGI